MKKLLVLTLIIVSISLVSAQIYLFYDINNANKEYKEKIVEQEVYEDDGIYYTKANITYIDYDNPERYSTYDYRYGYSYRTTEGYLQRYKKIYADKVVSVEKIDNEPRIVEKYFESLDKKIEVECYDSPPKNKFIYRKCKD